MMFLKSLVPSLLLITYCLLSMFMVSAMPAANGTAAGYFGLGPGGCFGQTCTQGQYCSTASVFGGKCRQCDDAEMFVWCETQERREEFIKRNPICFYICDKQADVHTLNAPLHERYLDAKQTNEEQAAKMLNSTLDGRHLAVKHGNEEDKPKQGWSPELIAGVVAGVVVTTIIAILLIFLLWRKMRRTPNEADSEGATAAPQPNLQDMNVHENEETSFLDHGRVLPERDDYCSTDCGVGCVHFPLQPTSSSSCHCDATQCS